MCSIFRVVLADVEPFDAATLEGTLNVFVECEGFAAGQIVHAMRAAVTGKAAGFGLFETLALLGRERCLTRIDQTLAKVNAK